MTGRTGSDAFQSQLDSHPEIFVFNGVLFFHNFWNNACTVQNTDEPCVEDIADEFIGQHIALLKSRYDLGEKKYALGENMDQSIEIDLVHLKGFKQEITIHSSVPGCRGLQHKCRHMILGETQEKIWVKQITLMSLLFVLI